MRSPASFFIREKMRPYSFATDDPIVLITNATSFIGRALAKSIVSQKVNLLLVDRTQFAHTQDFSRLLFEQNVRAVTHDTTSPWPVAMPAPAFVIHIPEIRGETISDAIDSSTAETQRVLELGIRHHAKVALVTSMFVYEAVQGGTLSEHRGEERAAEQSLMRREVCLRMAEEVLADAVERYDLNGRVIRLPDVYGPEMPAAAQGILGHFLAQAQRHGRMVLRGDGLFPLFPLFISDAVAGIITALFTTGTDGKIFCLLPTEHTTALSLAHKVQALLAPRRILISFTDEDYEMSRRLHPPGANLPWKATTPIDEGLLRTLCHPLPLPEIALDVHQQEQERPLNHRTRRKNRETEHRKETGTAINDMARPIRRFRVLLLPHTPRILLLVFIVGVLSATVLIAQALFTIISGAYTRSNIQDELLVHDEKVTRRARDAGEILQYIGEFVRAPGFLLSYAGVFAVGEELADARVGLHAAGRQLQEILSGLSAPPGGAFGDALTGAKSELDIADFHLGTAQALLAALETNPPPLFFSAEFFRSLREHVVGLRADLRRTQHTAKVLQYFFGVHRPSTYLILFQDNSVLRPGGGLIRSIGRLRVDRGHIVEFSLEAADVIDGQRQSLVAPPIRLRPLINEDEWSLRESSWWAHFPETAQASRFLYRHAIGEDVDGVVALDQDALRALLLLVGPIAIPGYANGITGRTMEHAKVEYGRDDFLGLVGRSVMNRVAGFSGKEWFQFAATLQTLFREKHVMVSASDPTLATSLASAGWDGAWHAWLATDERVLVLPTAVVSAEIGGDGSTPTNHASIRRTITIAENGSLSETVSLTSLQPVRADSSPPSAQTYVRVYLPHDVEDISLLENGKKAPFDLEQEAYWTWIGFWMTSLPETESTATVSFTHTKRIGITTTAVRLVHMKQPGTDALGLTTTLSHPPIFAPTTVSPTATTREGSLVWETDLRRDRLMTIELGAVAGVGR